MRLLISCIPLCLPFSSWLSPSSIIFSHSFNASFFPDFFLPCLCLCHLFFLANFNLNFMCCFFVFSLIFFLLFVQLYCIAHCPHHLVCFHFICIFFLFSSFLVSCTFLYPLFVLVRFWGGFFLIPFIYHHLSQLLLFSIKSPQLLTLYFFDTRD